MRTKRNREEIYDDIVWACKEQPRNSSKIIRLANTNYLTLMEAVKAGVIVLVEERHNVAGATPTRPVKMYSPAPKEKTK